MSGWPYHRVQRNPGVQLLGVGRCEHRGSVFLLVPSGLFIGGGSYCTVADACMMVGFLPRVLAVIMECD
jgi:hypothetical protein